MINQKEAIDILQAHIVTYRHQVTDEGWEEMVRAGIARNNIYDKLAYRADAEKQIQAYEMAIQALARGGSENLADRCYLGSHCPFQTPVRRAGN